MATILMYLMTICNIIFYILVALLLIALSLLVIILFVPIRYDIKGLFPLGENESYLEMKFDWLFGMFRFKGSYKDAFNYSLRVFGMSIHLRGESVTKSQYNETDYEELNRNKPLLEKRKIAKESIEYVSDVGGNNDLNKKLKSKNMSRIDNAIKGVKKIKWHLKNICAIIKRLYDAKEKFEVIFQKWIHRQTLENIKVELLYLWNKMRPRYMKLHGEVGLEDPAHTGIVLAIVGVLLPVADGYDLEIAPNFNDKILEIDTHLTGKIKIIYFLNSTIRVLKDKGNRYTFKVLRKVKW